MTKQSLKEYVYETLKQAIYEKKLIPGQKLVEYNISQSLDVSRTPIRQAFAQLQEEGFLVISPNRGAQVIHPTVKEIQEAFSYRKHLELKATQNIFEWITAEQIDEFHMLIYLENKSYKEKNLPKYIEVNKQFHYLLINNCNNRFLKSDTIKMINQTHIYLALYDQFYLESENKDTRGFKEHQVLIEYLETGNKNAFYELLDYHIVRTINEYESRIKPIHQASDLFN